jgi:hypothetical protein
MRERPLSTRAQIAQATFSAVLLGLAVFGYFYSVRPVYTKQRAVEEAAKLQADIADYRGQLQQYKLQLRPYVIDQYTKKVLATGAELLTSTSARIMEIRTGSSAGTSSPDELSPLETLYARHGVSINDRNRPRDPQHEIVIGRDVVEMNFANPEFELLDPGERGRLIERIREYATADRAFDEPLVFQREAVLPPNTSNRSEQDMKGIDEKIETELRRQIAAHVAFIDAMERMTADFDKK